MAVEEVAIASEATGMVSGDDGGGGSVVATSADVSGGWTASFVAPAASALLLRCPAVTGCALGVIGRCVDGDMAMVGLVWWIDRIGETDSAHFEPL